MCFSVFISDTQAPMKVSGEGHRECTAETGTRKLFATLCYYCREKEETVKLRSLCSCEYKLLSSLHCCVKSVMWQLGLGPFWKDASSS